MKILFISDYFPPFAPGGAEWSSFYLAKALAKKGCEVIVLTFKYGKIDLEKEKEKGFKVIGLPFPFKLEKNQQALAFWINHNPVYWFYVFLATIKVCLKQRPEVVHLHSRFSLPGVVLAKLVLGFKLVFTVRNTVLFCPAGLCLRKKRLLKKYAGFGHFWTKCRQEYLKVYLKPKGFLKKSYDNLSLLYYWVDTVVKRWCLRLVDELVFISQALKDLYLKAGLVDKAKSSLVYNLAPAVRAGISSKRLKELRKRYDLLNKQVVLFAGRKTSGKGVEVLLKAFERVYRENKKASLVLVGKGRSGEDKRYLRDIPPTAHRQLMVFYQLADLVVVPSLGFEPMGRVPLEAGVFKKPVIVSDSGGLAEQVVDGQTGLVVPKAEPKVLAAGILRLLKDKDLSESMGRKHFENVKEKFNQEKLVSQQLGLYKSLAL